MKCLRIVEDESRSEPDSKQKTETELTFWCVFPYFVHSQPIQSNHKQKQVCTSHNWKCDHLWYLWPKCYQTCFAKKTIKKKKRNKFGHKFKIVTVCDRHKCHKFVTHSVWLVQTCFCFRLEILGTALSLIIFHGTGCMPPEQLLGDGFSTPMPLFCLMCTIRTKPAFWIGTR